MNSNNNNVAVGTTEERLSQLKYKIAYQVLAKAAVAEWEAALRTKLDEESKAEIARLQQTIVERSEIDANLRLERIKQSNSYRHIAALIKAAGKLVDMFSFEKVNSMSLEQLQNNISFEDQLVSSTRTKISEGEAAFGNLTNMRVRQALASPDTELEAMLNRFNIDDDGSDSTHSSSSHTNGSSGSDSDGSSSSSGSSSDDDLEYSDVSDSPRITPTFPRVSRYPNLAKLAKENGSDTSSSASHSSEKAEDHSALSIPAASGARRRLERKPARPSLFPPTPVLRPGNGTILVGSIPGLVLNPKSPSGK